MLQPLMAQPETKVAIVAFDSRCTRWRTFTSNQDAVEAALRGLQAGR